MYSLTLENLKPFLLGGKSDFIIRNKTNNNHLNYSIKLNHNKSSQKQETIPNEKLIYYVYFKSTQKEYIGTIISSITLHNTKPLKSIVFYPTNKSSILDKPDITKQINTFTLFFDFIFNKNKIPNNVEVLYTGECCKCGKKLTDPKYIERGIGAWCSGEKF